MIERGEIDRVVVIAPRREVVSQWAGDFKTVTGRYMAKITASEEDVEGLGIDVCATWSALQGLQDAVQAVCRASRVLVICDEHHHAAVSAAWGDSADSAFAGAEFSLIRWNAGRLGDADALCRPSAMNGHSVLRTGSSRRVL